jgi:hypothetical protein
MLNRIWAFLRGFTPQPRPAGIVQPDTVDNVYKLERVLRNNSSVRTFFDAHVDMGGSIVHLVYDSVYYFETTAEFRAVKMEAPNHPSLDKFLTKVL